jgi:hypothetical protein
MKVRCVRIRGWSWYGDLPLTIGKVYNVIEVTQIPFNRYRYDDYTGPIYKLVNDRCEISGYSNECVRVLTKAEERDERLKELGV